MATKKAESTAVAKRDLHDISVGERFNDNQLREVTTFDDAVALAVQAYGNVQSITEFELGNGFKLVRDEDKDRLIGVTFIILHYAFNEGDFNEFASCVLVTQNGDRLIFNGGVAIVDQLRDIAEGTGRYGGILVQHGLRKSEYKTCTKCGKPRKPSATVCEECGDTSEKRASGATYYLDTSE